MTHLDRDSRRLLVELALAAAGQRFHEEAMALAGVFDLLIPDPLDRAVCAASVHLQSGDADVAVAALAGRNDEAARRLLALANAWPVQSARLTACVPRIVR